MVRFHSEALYSPIAQLVEHSAVNRSVVGSSPTGRALKKTNGMWLSLVERLVRDQEVAGSSPVIPTYMV